jgi:hypothetical protein
MNNTPFSSKEGTLEHIRRVNQLVIGCSKEMLDRAVNHDATKIVETELSGFNHLDPEFRKLPYGSPEYFQIVNKSEAKKAIAHHHKHNSHHPEYYEDGIIDMNMFDIIEMLCDWKAASERNTSDDNKFEQHLQYNYKRYKVPIDIQIIINNTAVALKFIV